MLKQRFCPADRFWMWMESGWFGKDDPSGLPELINHLDTFWLKRDLPNVALFRYEDMKADLGASMRRLASVLGVDVDEAKWPMLVEAATFDKMRNRAADLAPQVTDGFWQEDARFFHVGGSEQWRAFFDDADQERYEKLLNALASPELVAWINGA